MAPSTLLPCIQGIRIHSIANTANCIVLHLLAVAPCAHCPLCGHVSQHIHSHYRRTLADLPWNRVTVSIHLRARKFYCDHPDCPRRIFTEPLPELAARYARKTNRLQAALYLLGYALGGEAGARVAMGLGLAVSPDTLLHRVRQVGASVSSEPSVRVLGVDDWAFRKGHRYGTILVDLQRHRLLDLLPDRSAASLAEWLRTHPEIEIVSRDRASAYAEGIREGAPQARQVADRFHLLKNITDLLERMLTRHHRQLRQTTRELVAEQPLPVPLDTAMAQPPPRPPTRVQQDSACRRERCLARYQRVIELEQQGRSQRAIARKTGLSRNTIRKWIDAGGFPEQARRPVRAGKLAPFVVYLKQRWEQEAPSGVALFAELKAQGFTGSLALVQRYLQPWRAKSRASPPSHREEPPSARTVLWWLLGYHSKTDADLRQKQTAFVERLCQLCPAVKTAQELAVHFVGIVKQRRAADLDGWLEEAQSSQIVELMGFAKSLRQDDAAVREALVSVYSNGQVEGQVNRLKLIMRSMYGRAKLELLRAGVLPMQQTV
jgi:transposase